MIILHWLIGFYFHIWLRQDIYDNFQTMLTEITLNQFIMDLTLN